MKNRWTLIASAALAIIAATTLIVAPTGCGDDNGGSDSLTMAAYCDAGITVFCQQRLNCFSAAALAYEGYATQGECEQAFANTCPTLVASWQRSVDAARLSFDGGKAKSCIDDLRGASCDQFQSNAAAVFSQCTGVLVGSVAMSGDCNSWSRECVAGTWCEPNGWPTPTCDSGTCQSPQQQGQNCNALQGDVCVAGTVCAGGTCQAIRKKGENCAQVTTCEAGLFCGTDATCRDVVAIGEACDTANGDPCDAHSFCVNSKCQGIPKVGETCAGTLPNTKCWLGRCDVPAGQSEGTCMAYPGVGDACGGDIGTTCIDGFCDQTQAKCVALKANGQACEENAECDSLACDLGTMKCADEYCP